MMHSGPHPNYIARIHTSTGAYHTYHGCTILFGGLQLSKLLTPGLCRELKKHSTYPEMFSDAILDEVEYILPDFVNADDLTEQLRDTLAGALLFLHVWLREHPQCVTSYINKEYDTYKEFFDHTFNYVLEMESDTDIKALATKLKKSVQNIESYLGLYEGSMRDCIYSTQELLAAVLSAFCVYAWVTGAYL